MPARRQQKPNIVFFGIDSLRADHMSCYGYPRLTTPHSTASPRGRAVRAAPTAPTSRPPAATPRCSPGWTSSPPRSWRCATRARCAPRCKTLPEILRDERLQHHLRRLHRQSQPRAGLTSTSTIPAGAAGTKGAAPRRRTSTTSPCPSWTGWRASGALPALPAPHGPARALPAAGALRAHVLSRQRAATPRTSRWSR